LGRFQRKLSVPFHSVSVQAGPALKRCVRTDRRDSNSRTGGSNHALRTHRREWAAIEPMLPNKPRGVPRVNDRRVLNGIFWILRSGAPWRDLPEAFGPYTTCYNRFVRWRRAGVWSRIIDALAGAHCLIPVADPARDRPPFRRYGRRHRVSGSRTGGEPAHTVAKKVSLRSAMPPFDPVGLWAVVHLVASTIIRRESHCQSRVLRKDLH
jgi:transposase